MATSKVNLRQSSTKAAAEMTAAGIAAGFFPDHEAALERFKEVDQRIFATLVSDYEAEEAEVAASPQKAAARRSQGKPGSPNKGVSVEDALATEINHGKFKGLTIGQVEAFDLADSEDYGYDKPGRKYIEWLTTNEKNPFMQRRATLVVEARREEAA